MATLRTVTLGCKVNQYETEYVREGLLSLGYRDAGPNESADLCVVNTCTVTNEGDAKSRQIIRRIARQNPGSRIVVMGCYATRAPQEVAELPGVAEVIVDKRELPDWLGRFGVSPVPTGISQFAGRSRAFIKVQDGCMLKCSYCIIPYVRPKLASRPIDEIVAEAQRLVANGYRELVLTGIHLGHFGIDWNWGKAKHEWTRLAHLLERLVELDGEFRVRLSSIEATEVTEELLDVMARYPDRICPHLHVCLQSGSDAVLRRMRRRWGSQRFLDCCQRIRAKLDEPCLTTDIIVGFPGETEEDFEATLEVARKAGFWKIHVFPFSPRRQTPAAEMPDQVSAADRQQRVRRLTELEQELRREYMQRLVGRRLTLLAESSVREAPATLVGTSCRYVPVAVAGVPEEVGQLIEAEIIAVTEERLEAVRTQR